MITDVGKVNVVAQGKSLDRHDELYCCRPGKEIYMYNLSAHINKYGVEEKKRAPYIYIPYKQ